MEAYTYPVTEMLRVPGYRGTEPALQCTFEAKRVMEERHEQFKTELNIINNKQGYLDSIREELKCRSRAWKFQIFEIGRLIYEAKKQLDHGEFKPWIEENFELGYRTAHNCMKVYEACMGHSHVVDYFSPSCMYVICKPSFPEDLRQALFEGVKGPVDVKKKELVQIAMKYKNGEISIEDEEVQGLLKKQRDSTIWERFRIELEALERLFETRLTRINAVIDARRYNPVIKDDEDDFDLEEETGNLIERLKRIKAEINAMIEECKQKNESVS